MNLAKGSVVPLPAGAVIRVELGAVWVTQYPDGNDYFVCAGQTMRLKRRGAALGSALRDSDLRVTAGPRHDRWREFLSNMALRFRPA